MGWSLGGSELGFLQGMVVRVGVLRLASLAALVSASLRMTEHSKSRFLGCSRLRSSYARNDRFFFRCFERDSVKR